MILRTLLSLPRFSLLDALQADNGLTSLSYARWQTAGVGSAFDMCRPALGTLSIGGKANVQ